LFHKWWLKLLNLPQITHVFLPIIQWQAFSIAAASTAPARRGLSFDNTFDDITQQTGLERVYIEAMLR
jgi:hypothetical protein